MKRNTLAFLAAVLTLASLTAAPASASSFGIRGGVYTEVSKPVIGAQILNPAGLHHKIKPQSE
jgi:hypothetical protein